MTRFLLAALIIVTVISCGHALHKKPTLDPALDPDRPFVLPPQEHPTCHDINSVVCRMGCMCWMGA